MQDSIKTYLSSADETLKSVIERVDWPQIDSSGNVFHDLLSCIIEQQIHYRSSKRQFARMLESASISKLGPDNFPVFAEKALSRVKLSGSKLETVGRVVDFFQHNPPDWQAMSDAAVVQTLSGIKGVGSWTIDMILLFTLERPDIFPVQDYHLKRIMGHLYQIPENSKMAAEMQMIAGDWAPYRSYAVKYLLAWKNAQKQIRL